jgi:CHAD domain-containing protein
VSSGKPVSTVREVEHKFRVHGLFRIPDLSTVTAVSAVDDDGTIELESAYYDTADLRLAREGMTLRRRAGGDDAGWHLKVPVAGTVETRDELRLPLDAGDVGTPPPELLHTVRAIVRQSPVDLVATLRTTRRKLLLSSGSGEPAAELVDDTVSVVDGSGHVAARFRELELEERDGAAAELVEEVTEALVGSGAIGGEFVSKAARALGPQATAAPEVPEPGDVKPKDPARIAIQAHIARHTRAFRHADLAVRQDADDSVHQMRVAARRLRSGLRVFRPLLEPNWANALRDELAWVASGLGRLRESEVLLARLESHLPDDAEAARDVLLEELSDRMSTARSHALDMLGSDRYLALHEALVSASASPATTEEAEKPARVVLPPLVAKAWKRLSKRAKALLDEEGATPAGAPDGDWHATRIAAKRARYAAEAVAPALGSEAAALAKQLSRVTDVLGEHQDAAQAADLARELAADAEPTAAFALGVLYSTERGLVDTSRREFAALWPQASRRKWRRWLQP